ncbi:hypothetical protein BD311DRAFT_747534 [Dichomitus squalens]|uniref:Uncharacterized protein n=1 Tax=Dichomitus squalens TaxID=114155 RepID=A0A4Q9N5F4_9APHY|nr:hypothetical protein BD311DRAFT_747534 [Dichomitus squalens]
MEKKLGHYCSQLLGTRLLSSASSAATAYVLCKLTERASRGRSTPTAVPQEPRPSESRRQSTDIHPSMSANTSSLLRSQTTNLDIVPPSGYTSGLTQSICAMQEAPHIL